MNLLTFLGQYWWLVALIFVVLIVILIIESIESNQTKYAINCDDAILKVNDGGFIWVDTRSLEDFKQNAILGAKHVSTLKKHTNKVSKKNKYVYYCQKGNDSMKLAQDETQLYLKGGFEAWVAQKLPIDKGV